VTLRVAELVPPPRVVPCSLAGDRALEVFAGFPSSAQFPATAERDLPGIWAVFLTRLWELLGVAAETVNIWGVRGSERKLAPSET